MSEGRGDERARLAAQQAQLLRALLARDPAMLTEPAVAGEDGFHLAAMLIARLRFERLVRLSAPARAWFERDPRAFTRAFRRYHGANPPAAGGVWDEGQRFARWCAGQEEAAGEGPAASC